MDLEIDDFVGRAECFGLDDVEEEIKERRAADVDEEEDDDADEEETGEGEVELVGEARIRIASMAFVSKCQQ